MAILIAGVALRAICLISLLFTGVIAQSTSPSNDTSTLQGDVGFLMTTTLSNMATTIKIVPLTNSAGLSGSTQTLEALNPTGPLFLTNPQTVNSLAPGDIAYISCEPGDYTDGQVDAPRTINFAVNNRPVAIVLYSQFSARCSFSPSDEFNFNYLYTTEDANSSTAVLKGLNAASPRAPNTSIHVDLNSINGTNNDNGSSNNVLGRSPTTAVAMIILYSITGIITALFLIIIIVGAIRAHRHPERYGPRRIVGRPRQSRAKGIARAMLETLPIVKFGELEEDNKPATATQPGDMEMGVTDPEHVEDVAAPKSMPEDSAEGSHVEAKEGSEMVRTETTEGSAIGSATTQADNTIETGTAAVDNGLACSVCVEDFEKGQDVRVLPCKHRFHPECIDPWLLNVSGTCPLCRVDLRPTASHGDIEEDVVAPTATAAPATTSTEDATTAAAFNETTRRNRRSRILHTLNIGRMRNATPEERLAALRMLRNEQMIGSSTSGESTPRSRNRFSQRLSRTFGSRPHSGAATPRRNSGGLTTGRTTPSVETHPTPGMETTTEENTTEEIPTGELSPTVETPSILEGPQLGQAHMADAPHAAGSAHVVNVAQSARNSHEKQENVQNNGESSNLPVEAKKPASQTSPSNQAPELESTHPTASDSPPSPRAAP